MGATKKRYPQISLPQAIDLVKKVYGQETTSPAAPEVVAKHMGYNSLNGRSLGVLSALKKYGLLDSEGKRLKVSKAAVAIIVYEDDPENPARAKAIHEAAFSDPVFSSLRDHYGEKIPTESNVKAELQMQGFNSDAAATAASNYLETLRFALGVKGAYNPSEGDADSEEVDDVTPEQQSRAGLGRSTPPLPAPPGMQTVTLAVAPGVFARLQAPMMSEKQWENLEASLKAAKIALVLDEGDDGASD